MKLVRIVTLVIALGCTITGCAGDKGKELYETAQFEEKQGNTPHAIQLYEEIVRKQAGSELAKKAEARLAELKAKK
jgi:outer membrane protein assembly factor BamD (BamD/ComL family)